MFNVKKWFKSAKKTRKNKKDKLKKKSSLFEKAAALFCVNDYDDYDYDCCDDGTDTRDDRATIFINLLLMEKTFSSTLFEYIDKKGISDADCYKRAGIDRRTFSKIRCDSRYKPSKGTILALSIALELNLEDTNRLLRSTGLALSESIKSDVIVKYFIVNGIYDIHKVNEMLHEFGESPLC